VILATVANLWHYLGIYGNIWQPLPIFGTGDIWEYLDRPFGDFLTQTREWIDFPAEAAPIWKAIPSTLIFHIKTLVSLGSMAISGT